MVTNPKIVFLIVIGLLVYGFISLVSVVFLIVNHIDAALIAIVSTAGGTAIGNVSGMLTNTRTSAAPAPMEGTGNGKPQPIFSTKPTPVTVVNAPSNPVPISEEPQPKTP